jgi:cytochrome P450
MVCSTHLLPANLHWTPGPLLTPHPGPIIRIGPDELHIKDSSYYSELYNQKNRLDKYEWYYGMIANPVATFSTIKHDIHRIRRTALNPFFSTSAVNKFHFKIQEVVDRMTKRMQKSIDKGEPIPVFFAFRCVSVDIICEYLFGKENYLVERQDWGRSFYSAWRVLWEMMALIRQLPWILPLMRMTPRWVLTITSPAALEVLDMEKAAEDWTRELLESDPEDMKQRSQKTVLWELAHSDSLPASERTLKRLAMEGPNIMGAGFETTGNALSHLMYGILNDPNIHSRLLKELEEAIPDPDNMPSHQVLEKLPYLHAVIKEGIR